MKEGTVSRRGFVQGAAVAAAAAAAGATAASLTGCKPEEVDKIVWDKEVDVVVVGYGGAGAATAITAHDEGAEVLVLEKMDRGGGNTCVSGGGFLCPGDANLAYTYINQLFELSHSNKDEQINRTFADESVKNVDWFMGLKPGIELARYGGAGYPTLPGSETINKMWMVVSSGTQAAGLFGVYTYAVEEDRGIEVMFSTPGKELIQNADGEIIGIIATQPDGTDINIKAKRGVVLTTGGYEYNGEMLRNYTKGAPIYALGWEGNTGDGIIMSQKVGAGMWHLNGASCPLGVLYPNVPGSYQLSAPGTAYIWVDQAGKRFIDEAAVEGHAGLLAVDFYATKEHRYPRIPAYLIFDGTQNRAIGASFGIAPLIRPWSTRNVDEIASGKIRQDATLEGLAAKLNPNMDPKVFAATVEKWNDYVMETKTDLDFGRTISATSTAAALVTPPYYGVEIVPTLLNTQGGPRRNVKAQVLDSFERPIPRLYSSGELGCMWGIIYQGSGNNGEAMVFGRIAGTNVAAELPWDEPVEA